MLCLRVPLYQVLPEWKPSMQFLSQGCPTAWAQKAKDCLKLHQKEDETSCKRAQHMESKQQVTNTMYLRGVDHALQAIGRPLRCFLPARRPLPLTATQVRYYTVLEGRPAGESLPAGVQRQRSCILEKDTGKRWLELPDTPVPRRHHIM